MVNLGAFVKKLQNIMRSDAGINGDAQRIEQMVWILFLKVYDVKEDEWELLYPHYQSIIPVRLRWKNWAKDNKDGKALTGQALLDFVNNELFPRLKTLPVSVHTEQKQNIVRDVFTDSNNYMKDGILLRQVINEIDALEIAEYKDRHAFNEIYESILKSLQSAGNAGEFYTPRAVTDFMVQMVDPKLGETIGDLACGTGGFLTSSLNQLWDQVNTVPDRDQYVRSVYGMELKPLPYLLCITNLLLHNIDSPLIFHGDSLDRDIRSFSEDEKFDIILMNPPYGGAVTPGAKTNFPVEYQSSETVDLFMALAIYRLKRNGRAAIITPDGFLFGTDGAKTAIKKRLLEEFNLHTIIRLPGSVFSPYTSITTNILFFDNAKKTDQVWYYRVDMPEGFKHFSKTKPMELKHFEGAISWWKEREDIQDEETQTFKARAFTVKDLEALGYNLDQCGYPSAEEEILSPEETIRQFHEKRDALNAKIDKQLAEIERLLGLKA